MPSHRNRQPSGIEFLQQIAMAHVASRVLAAGVCLNVFNVIPGSGATAQAIAQSTQTSLRGIRILLDSLASLQLLRKSEGQYFLTEVSETHLRKEREGYMGHLWETEDCLAPWNHLIDSVRSGKPWKSMSSLEDDDNSFVPLDRSLRVVHFAPAQKAAAHLAAGFSGLNVLDVACGSGVWGVALAKNDPQARVVAQDFSSILKLTKQYVESQHVERQFSYLPGNLRKIDFGENLYDLVILGNILHYEGESSSQVLLARVNRALKEKGRLAIIDIVANQERTAPQSVIAFALVMLLGTSEGDVFTIQQYQDWIRAAGFQSMDTVDIETHSPMIIARK
jgi:ubiquinone/menaquinone biosynthesis C-methylase UbiE